tara:strand:- start:385 stop:672 length:288 start_codon:yes stop_codon:yes gene_type:complete
MARSEALFGDYVYIPKLGRMSNKRIVTKIPRKETLTTINYLTDEEMVRDFIRYSVEDFRAAHPFMTDYEIDKMAEFMRVAVKTIAAEKIRNDLLK